MKALSGFECLSVLLAATTLVVACGSARDDDPSSSPGGIAAGSSARPGTSANSSSGAGGSGGAVSATGSSAAGVPNLGSGSAPSWNAGTLECRGVPIQLADGGAAGEAAGSGAACAGLSLEAEAVPVDLFIMMDRSVSMNELVPGTSQTRWQALRVAVEHFVEQAKGSSIRAGIGFFGRSGARDDALDCDAGAYATPSVEIGNLADVGKQLIAAIDATPPGGLTPTLPALQGALQHAREWAVAHPGRATSVVLVTDGFPTQCQSPVSIADISAVASAARTAAPFVRTFVIGLAAGFNLDSIAVAGGTNHAYLVDEGDVSTSFARTLSNISDSSIVCEYEVPSTTDPNLMLDYDHLQLVYSPASGAAEEVPRLEAGSSCGRNPNGGWYYDNPLKPAHLLVCPCTCARFAAGRVDVRLGCEPYIGLR